MGTQFPVARTDRSSHPARAGLVFSVWTCPAAAAAASPAPPASAPASRPRRAGSRIPMGARGAHTDRTGPRVACQACPSRAGGRCVRLVRRQPPLPPSPPHRPSPGISHEPVFLAGLVRLGRKWCRGAGATTPPQPLGRHKSWTPARLYPWRPWPLPEAIPGGTRQSSPLLPGVLIAFGPGTGLLGLWSSLCTPPAHGQPQSGHPPPLTPPGRRSTPTRRSPVGYLAVGLAPGAGAVVRGCPGGAEEGALHRPRDSGTRPSAQPLAGGAWPPRALADWGAARTWEAQVAGQVGGVFRSPAFSPTPCAPPGTCPSRLSPTGRVWSAPESGNRGPQQELQDQLQSGPREGRRE